MQLVRKLLRRAARQGRSRLNRGLSTAELVGIIVVIGILGSLGATYIAGLTTTANTNTGNQNAVTLATLANSYLESGGSVAVLQSGGTIDAPTAIAAFDTGQSAGGILYQMTPTISVASAANYTATQDANGLITFSTSPAPLPKRGPFAIEELIDSPFPMHPRVTMLGNSDRCRTPRGVRQSGLTLIEGIGMIVLIGLMSALAFPAIGGLRRAGQDQQAMAVAQAINQAQQTYQLRVANAGTNWAAAATSDAKYQLLSSYIPYAADTLEDYSPSGYALALGSTLSTKVVITGPNGTVTY